MTNFTHKIAVYVDKHCADGRILADWADGFPEYTRVSEFLTVELVPLPPKEVIGKQLDALGAEEKALRNKFQEHLNDIEHRRGKLLALTHKEQP